MNRSNALAASFYVHRGIVFANPTKSWRNTRKAGSFTCTPFSRICHALMYFFYIHSIDGFGSQDGGFFQRHD